MWRVNQYAWLASLRARGVHRRGRAGRAEALPTPGLLAIWLRRRAILRRHLLPIGSSGHDHQQRDGHDAAREATKRSMTIAEVIAARASK